MTTDLSDVKLFCGGPTAFSRPKWALNFRHPLFWSCLGMLDESVAGGATDSTCPRGSSMAGRQSRLVRFTTRRGSFGVCCPHAHSGRCIPFQLPLSECGQKPCSKKSGSSRSPPLRQSERWGGGTPFQCSPCSRGKSTQLIGAVDGSVLRAALSSGLNAARTPRVEAPDKYRSASARSPKTHHR